MTRREPKKEPDYLIEVFARTIKSFFPKIGKWVNKIKDPRYTKKADYHRSIMFWQQNS